MELLLIRHGLPVRVEHAEGPADPHLADAGRQQAAALAAWLAPLGLTALGSSPMKRAVETVQPLVDATGLPSPTYEGIAEMDRDARHYIPIEEIRGTDDPRWAEVIAFWTSPEAAELRTRFAREVVGTIESVIAANPGGRVALVCHGGVINAYLAHVLGLDQPFVEPDYTSISRLLAHTDGRRQVASVNETPHLVPPPWAPPG
jgi:2,3-bisphosphoglycerate-dependent phosphoglycerate mutase